MNKKAQTEYEKVWKKIGGLIIIGIIIITVIGCFKIVPAGKRGILLEWGAVKGIPLSEGLQFKIPIAQEITTMDVKTQKYQADADSASKDLQSIISTVATNYHVNPDAVGTIYKTIGFGYQDRVIAPAIAEAVKSATAKFTAEELITKRTDVKDMIQLELTDRLLTYNIIVETVSIVNFKFSSGFDAAIEQKVKAEQDALKAQKELERIKFEAEQQVAEASGQANATLMNANADAAARLLLAQTEAEALRIQGEALRENPEVKDLRTIEKWNGVLPVYMMGDAIPLIQIPIGEE